MLRFGKGIERIFPLLRAPHEQNVFPALFPVKPLRQAEMLGTLVDLRDLAHGAGGAVAQHFREQADVGVHILRGGIKDQRAAEVGIPLQKSSLFRILSAQKTQKREYVRRKTGQHERRHEGARAGDEGISDAIFAQGVDKDIAGVGDDGRARVRYDRHRFALFGEGNELFRRRRFVEFMAGDERLFYLEMVQKFERVAGVLAEDDVCPAQRFQRAQGDVSQIPDGRCDKIHLHGLPPLRRSGAFDTFVSFRR